jgi:hypothetical protein
MLFNFNEEKESETLIKYRELCIAALDEYSVNHPNHLTVDEKQKIEDVITCLFDAELDFINRYP